MASVERGMAGVVPSETERVITGEELASLPDLGPCELVDGRIVPMAPTGAQHGWVEGNASDVLRAFVRPRRLGRVLVGEVGIYTRRNPDRVRAADVVYISRDRYAMRAARSGYLDIAPELVVEVLSPRDTVMETTQKLREYFGIGVRLVWIVDPESRLVYAYRSPTEVREFTEPDDLPGDDVLPGFSAPVSSLFEE
jgi:Uma2 family endonuclease